MRRSLGAIVLIPVTLAAGCGGTGAGEGGAEGQWTTPTAGTPAVAPAELVAVGRVSDGMDAFEEVRFLDPDEASLVGPHRGYAFGAVVATTTVTPDQAAANDFFVISGPEAAFGEEGLQAADGHEFLVLRFEEPNQASTYTNCTGPLQDPDGPDADVTATIRVGDEEVELDPTVGQLGSAGTTLLVSVPTGEDATLVLDDAGRDQSLDLRSGERGDDAIELYYPRLTATLDDGELDAFGEVQGGPRSGDPVGITGTLNDAGLLPYDPELGWADRGRAWLCVTLALLAQYRSDAVVTIDAAATFALETRSGTTIAAEPGELTVQEFILYQGGPTSTLLFNVSDGFESGTLRFAPQGTVTVNETQEGALVSLTVGSGSVRMDR